MNTQGSGSTMMHIFLNSILTRAVTINGENFTFDVDVLEQEAIHSWKAPHDLNMQDDEISYRYDENNDTLRSTNMIATDENYIRINGNADDIKTNVSGDGPMPFVLHSSDISHPVNVYCLQDTTTSSQLRQLTKKEINLTASSCDIDFELGLNDKYMTNLLTIGINLT